MSDGMQWKLTPEEFDVARERVAKINARAEKRGFTGRLELVGEQVTETRTVAGLSVEEVFYRASVSGEAPKYGGWTLLAALDWTDSGLIVRTAPGVESIDRTGLEPGKCDHCGVKRERRKAMVVSDGKQTFQVGSTCLKDFTGWTMSMPFLSDEDVEEPLSGLGGGGGERTFTVESVLRVSWAVVTTFGFVKSREPGSTREKVATVLAPGRSRHDRKFADAMRPAAEKAAPMGEKVRAFILSDEFAGESEYVLNLKTLCAGESVGYRHLGILVSAPQAMARAQERTFIREREREQTVNEWVGEKKQRIEINAKITAVRFSEGDWGATTVYTLLADTGHLFTWFASRALLGEETTTDFQRLAATVKGFDEFRGQKTTVVTRCKPIEAKVKA